MCRNGGGVLGSILRRRGGVFGSILRRRGRSWVLFCAVVGGPGFYSVSSWEVLGSILCRRGRSWVLFCVSRAGADPAVFFSLLKKQKPIGGEEWLNFSDFGPICPICPICPCPGLRGGKTQKKHIVT